MGNNLFIMSYVQACAAGNLAFSECSPVWQFAVIAALLTMAIAFLLFLVMGPQGRSAKN